MSEFREDPVSGDWVIIAPGRAKRPEELLKARGPRKATPRSSCPFEDLKKSGNWPPIALYPSMNWTIAVIPNKYPALTHGAVHAMGMMRGIYQTKTGVGDHEIVVTRDHRKSLADLTPRSARELFSAIHARHNALAKDRCHAYVATFFNWGPDAGASLSHPRRKWLCSGRWPGRWWRSQS